MDNDDDGDGCAVHGVRRMRLTVGECAGALRAMMLSNLGVGHDVKEGDGGGGERVKVRHFSHSFRCSSPQVYVLFVFIELYLPFRY